MNNKLKNYQLKKFKHYIKKTDLIFFFFITNLPIKNQLELDQKLSKNNLKIYKIKNTIATIALQSSIFLNTLALVNGPISMLSVKNSQLHNLNLLNLLNIYPNTFILTIKLNKKIYSNTQLKTISTLNYKDNIVILNKTFKKLIKIPYLYLKK